MQVRRSGGHLARVPAAARVPFQDVTLHGPSRTIVVEPVERPEPLPAPAREPAPAPPPEPREPAPAAP
jgi:hypothetical protein